MENVIEHVGEMLKRLEFLPHSPAFHERALLVLESDSSKKTHEYPTWRSVAAPVLSTDLGVRWFYDNRTFYESHCNIAGIQPICQKQLVSWLTESTETFFSRADAAILFFGAYEEVALAIKTDTDKFLSQATYHELILAGTVLAALKDNESVRFFTYARNQSKDPVLKYLAAHRLAATEIKRLQRSELGREVLEEALDNYFECHENYPLETALKLNLEALVYFIKGESTRAMQALELARATVQEAVSTTSLSTVERSMAARYSSQIAINIAQVFIELKDFNNAIARLEENLVFVAKLAPEYQAEALSELAAALYFAGEYEKSLRVGMHSFGYLFHLGNVKAMRLIRKIVAAGLFKMGRVSDACRIVELIDDDPLGILAFDEVY